MTFFPLYASRPFGHIIHLGAGAGSDLENYLKIQPQEITLVEADPEAARKLRARARDLRNVKVVETAVSDRRSSQVPFFVFNLKRVSSLRRPDALLKVYPGLNVRKTINVSLVPASEIVRGARIYPEHINWLVVDTPGEESAVIKSLLDSDAMEVFQAITLNCSEKPLYEGGQPAEIVLGWLMQRGFALRNKSASEQPGVYTYFQEKDPVLMELIDTRKALAELKRLHTGLQNELKEVKEAKSVIVRRLEEEKQAKTELEKNLQAAIKTSVKRKEVIAEERERARSLGEELQTKIETLRNLNADVETLFRERRDLSEQIHDLQDRLANSERYALEFKATSIKRKENLEALTERQKDLTATLQEKEERIERLCRENQSMKEEIEEYRKKLADLADEVQRAESQIDLIRDTFLKDSEL